MGEARLSPGSCCLLQASYMVSCMTLRSEQCKARPEQVAGQGWGCVSYLEVAELGFYLLALVKNLEFFTTYKMYFVLYCVHIFLAVIKTPFSSGKWRGSPLFSPTMKHLWKQPKTCGHMKPTCLGNTLEYLDWKFESLLGRD